MDGRVPDALHLPHTASVQFIGAVWRIGLPLVVVASSALVLVLAVRARGELPPLSRSFGWVVPLVWLTLVGDAVLGDQRPVFERQWKGTAALLVGLGGAVYLWKRHRQRRGTRQNLH
ncbi:hypothetical protein Prum_094750 [Phytohabitans rumicis]|uniref:Uncharacterized protein n=1 Tax=Phytohabitans rumicis TaxID=1076125 RepID=A0A6V8LF33_9ACTN|nr:hypothetical protein Prum_094750 [Phytohabitans rumicis]